VATRTNCVEYVGTNRVSSLAAGVTEEQTVTVVIPETASRAFISVYMEVFCNDDNASTSSRGSMTARTLGVGIDAVADSDVTVTNTLSDSSDQASFYLTRDLTSYFTTNFTSTSHTVGLRFSFTQTGTNALSVNNVSMRLVVTYSYDDTSEATRVKTVRIPLQSKLGVCGTSEEEIYSNGTTSGGSGITSQIPDLSSFLPEASISFKDIFFDIEWNDAYSGTTDQVVSLKTASDATYNPGTYEKGNNTLLHNHLLWKRTDLATNAVQAFKFWATSAAHNHPAVILVVTYTYDHSASNDQIASLLIPIASPHKTYAWSTAAAYLAQVEFWIEEPTTITLKHSAVQGFSAIGSVPSSYNMRCGAASYTQYTRGAQQGGNSTFLHRVDAAGLGGLSIARGKNLLTFNYYYGSNQDYVQHMLILNYVHGKPAAGSGVANHTVKRLAMADGSLSKDNTVASQAATIPESAYWVNGYGVHVGSCAFTTAGQPSSFEVVRTTGDIVVAAQWAFNPNAELASWSMVNSIRQFFYRFAGEPNAVRMDPTTARTWSYNVPVASNWQLISILTYHAITKTISGDVSGSGGGTVTLKAHYAGAASQILGPGEQIASTSRSGDGSYSMTWYDDTEDVVVRAKEDSTHVGASDIGPAS